ncbi:MAG: two-component sensor histidine kinase [Rhizobium sp.]|nr:two-component sensor histidine kinase [Rhizobium sp.]
MRLPRSLQARLALAVGLPITVLWLAAASVTAHRLGHEMEEVFDKGLQATAERILPLAIHDLRRERRDDSGHDDEDDDRDEHIGRLRTEDEAVTYVVRNREGRVLLRAAGASDAVFPPYDGRGFRQTETHRLYYDAALDGGLTIAVAEPLDHRQQTSRGMLIALILPLIVVIPLSLLAIVVAVRRGFRPVRTLRQDLAKRGAQDLSALPDGGLPTELEPIIGAVNQLLDRLRAAFEAERAFAASAAHELRTPVAGAIAQAQRLRTETNDVQARQRATDIETTLKRLMRMSEKLMQLARAEGSRLELDEPSDLRIVVRLVAEDFTRSGSGVGRLDVVLPDVPVLSTLDPDAFGILCRNLIENALRHGAQDRPITVTLEAGGLLSVCNEGPALPPEAIDRLMQRFERGSATTEGSGLGLAIVKAIADRAGAAITVTSPLSKTEGGVKVSVLLPLAVAR